MTRTYETKYGVLVVFCCLLLANVPAFAEAAEWKTDTFQFRLADNGRPAVLCSLPENAKILNTRNPGLGFYLSDPDKQRTPLSLITVDSKGRLTASTADGQTEIVFSVRVAPTYLSFRIDRVKGVSTARGTSLHLELNSDSHVRVTELDYMTRVQNESYGVRVHWDSIWHRTEANPLGGFALLVADDEADADETLLQIWVDEQLPHPKVDGEWTLDRARAWVTDWQQRFASRSQMVVEGDSMADLEAMLPYAERAEIDEIYLFTNTWRTDSFWPNTQPNWHVNRQVFPRGEVDLLAFSERVAAKGMRLNLHYVSGGIGPRDPIYVGTKPDRRLACWARGTLVEAAGTDTQELVFRPMQSTSYPPALPHFFQHNHVRIENEIVRVGSFEVLTADRWVLHNCQRGQFLTQAAAYEPGADTAGLIVPYGQNYVPDNDSTLLDEIAAKYAGLINRCQIGHTEYDGAEIHCCDGRWGYLKFAGKIYQNLDHPVTVHDSSGSAPRCYFEYRLHSTQQILRGSCPFTHGNWCAPVALASLSRPASTLLDAHFVLSQGHLGGALGITKPEPMFGVTETMLKTHGLTATFIRAVRDWKAISRLLTDDQRRQIDDSLTRPKRSTSEFSRHAASNVVHVARNSDSHYQIVPVRVLTRETGDILWQQGQEHGPIGPRQFVKPGQEIQLRNPDAPQPVQFIIRVLYATDPAGLTVPLNEAKSAHTTTRAADLFSVGNDNMRMNGDSVGPNVDLQVPAKSIHVSAQESLVTHVTEEAMGVLRLQAENNQNRDAWAFDSLPSWACRLDMSTRRGIGMTVTGDGSGAVLLFQITGRDYVVPIDFTGPKYIEIPHGEVAWADGRWGWRMKTKRTDYAKVSSCKLGFGYLPPKSKACVQVAGLSALAEIPTALTDPVIRVGDGMLTVKGRVLSDQILMWQGGDLATVYDSAWNPLREVPVEKRDYLMSTGASKVSITSAKTESKPWLEVQFLTEGKPMIVPKQ